MTCSDRHRTVLGREVYQHPPVPTCVAQAVLAVCLRFAFVTNQTCVFVEIPGGSPVDGLRPMRAYRHVVGLYSIENGLSSTCCTINQERCHSRLAHSQLRRGCCSSDALALRGEGSGAAVDEGLLCIGRSFNQASHALIQRSATFSWQKKAFWPINSVWPCDPQAAIIRGDERESQPARPSLW